MSQKEHRIRVLDLAGEKLSEIMPELSPKAVGDKYYLTCPGCGEKGKAYYYKNGGYICCSRKNSCNYQLSLFDYLQARESWPSGNFSETFRRVADMVGYSLPALSTEQVERINAYNAECAAREQFFTVCKTHFLFNDEAEPLKAYLSGRGFTAAEQEEINDIGLFNVGLFTAAIAAGEINGEAARIARGFVDKKDYPLVIPCRGSDGLIKHFIFRTDKNIKPKYLFESGSKKDELFNIQAARSARTDEIYLVEGAIDALRLTHYGLPNVAALCGVSLNDGHIEQLKNYKFKNVVLMLNLDKAGIDGTKKIIESLNRKGLKTYFVALPSGIKDPDEFLRDGRTVAGLKSLPRKSGLLYVAEKEFNDAGDDAIKKNKAVENILRFVEVMPDDVQFGREQLLDLFSERGFSGAVIEKKITEIELKKAEGAARLKTAAALKNASKDIEGGASPSEVMARVADVHKAIRLENFVNVFKPYTFEMMIEECVNTPPALELDVFRWGADLHKHIKIQNGSLVIVAGRPRHGKTTFLLNMATSLCFKYPEKTFVFITYEEQARDIGIKIISILTGPRGELKGKLDIENAFRNGHNYDALKSGIEKYRTYTQSGRLLFDCQAWGITELCNHINFFKNNYNLGGVFVDYIQKIPNDKGVSSFSRQNEIQYISGQLLETARSCDIPIIVGAQFNRRGEETTSTVRQKDEQNKAPGPKVKLSHLRESGDLEQDANIVLGLYNAAAEGVETDLIDVDILKNRNGLSGISTHLKWFSAEYYLEAVKNSRL